MTQPWRTTNSIVVIHDRSHLQLRSFFSTHDLASCAWATFVEPQPMPRPRDDKTYRNVVDRICTMSACVALPTTYKQGHLTFSRPGQSHATWWFAVRCTMSTRSELESRKRKSMWFSYRRFFYRLPISVYELLQTFPCCPIFPFNLLPRLS